MTHKQTLRAALAVLQALPLHRAREIDQDLGCVNIIKIHRGQLLLQAVNNVNDFDDWDNQEDNLCDYTSRLLAR